MDFLFLANEPTFKASRFEWDKHVNVQLLERLFLYFLLLEGELLLALRFKVIEGKRKLILIASFQ